VNSSILFDLSATTAGGLGIFLLGMKYMSDGMQAVAGTSLRRMISAVTSNRLLATVVGTLVTCIVQSSSVTTVMVVGFVNSGVMQLSQAVGVIMGANIGTTITGWILVLNIGKYGLPMLGIAAFVYLFSRGDRWRYWAMVIMGIGMVFFGLELMKDGCAVVRKMPEFERWFQQFKADSYAGVMSCAFIGCLLTMVVQSSSATLGITISLAAQGIITFETAAALVLGENIGTTITAYLASLGATTNARRAAYFHVLFNMVGVFWVTLIFQWYIDAVRWFVGTDPLLAVQRDGVSIFPGTTPLIASVHSMFNVANTLLFLPFTHLVVGLLVRLVPGKSFKEKPHLTDLDVRMLDSPLMAIEQSNRELQKMGDSCEKMMDWLVTLMQQDDRDNALGEKLRNREKILDSQQDEISAFVTNLLSGNVPHAVAEEARLQLTVADEYESVSDYLADLEKFDRKLRKDGLRFTGEQQKDLLQLHAQVLDHLKLVNTGFKHQNRMLLGKIENPDKQVKTAIRELRRKHLTDLSNGNIPPQVSVAFIASLNAYDRVRDHSLNIAEALSGPQRS
jgi:phosphate:Na+ symporter